MKKVGYIPSVAARALRSKDKLTATQSLCCVLIFGPESEVADSFFNAIAISAEKESSKYGLCLLQSRFSECEDTSWLRLQRLLSIDGLCGVILAGSFSAAQIAVVKKHVKNIAMIDSPIPTGSSICSVESDNSTGARLAYEHFAKNNCKKLLVITGPTKKHYFATALRTASKPFAKRFDTIRFIDSALTAESGQEIILKVFGNGCRYDGVFSSDEVMVGVVRGLNKLNISIPEQVKLIGFDDIRHSAFLNPPLTTDTIDKARLGSEAVKLLVSMVRGQGSSKAIRKTVKAKLIIRESA